MPDTKLRLIRLPEVLHKVAMGRSWLLEEIAKGRFPGPVQIGDRAQSWLEGEVDEWIRLQVSHSRANTRPRRPAPVAAIEEHRRRLAQRRNLRVSKPTRGDRKRRAEGDDEEAETHADRTEALAALDRNIRSRNE